MSATPVEVKQAAPLALAEVAKLRCMKCGTGKLLQRSERLACRDCAASYPIDDGRFPDFLTEGDRRALEAELAFWAANFEGVEYQDESEASYQSWVQSIQSRPTDDVVELGCGSGALLKRLPARVRVGLEPAVSLLRPSNGFLGVLGTAHSMPFQSEAFDVVLFKHALHHVQDKRKGFLEAARILRPGGKLVIIEPNAEHPQRRIISSPGSLLRRTGIFSRFIGPVETFQALPELLRWAGESGLTVDSSYYCESHYDRLTVRQALQRAYSASLKRLVPDRWLYPNYFVSFRKPGAAATTL
jgi:SAM-dependent methyltransferase